MKKFLDRFYKNRPGENFKARGFKLMYYQTFYTPGLLAYLKRNNVKVILLTRENVLRNALSDLRARSTGVYHYQETEFVGNDLPKFNVDTNLLQTKMLHILNQNKKLEKLMAGMDHVKIRYEDFSEWDETMQRITRFLGVSRREVEEGAKRLNPVRLEDMIENYEEVKDWLKESSFGQFAN